MSNPVMESLRNAMEKFKDNVIYSLIFPSMSELGNNQDIRDACKNNSRFNSKFKQELSEILDESFEGTKKELKENGTEEALKELSEMENLSSSSGKSKGSGKGSGKNSGSGNGSKSNGSNSEYDLIKKIKESSIEEYEKLDKKGAFEKLKQLEESNTKAFNAKELLENDLKSIEKLKENTDKKSPEDLKKILDIANKQAEFHKLQLAKELLKDLVDKNLKKAIKAAKDKIMDFRRKNEKEAKEINQSADILKRLFDPNETSFGGNPVMASFSSADVEECKKLAVLFKENPALSKLMDFLGKAQSEQLRHKMEAVKKSVTETAFNIVHSGKSNVVGIHNSDDLTAMLPSEVALLSVPATQSLFYKKFVEKKLLTYDFVEKEKYHRERSEDDKKNSSKDKSKQHKGPFIICVDCSGSMSPDEVRIPVKALVFMIANKAYEESRDCIVYTYNAGVSGRISMNTSASEILKFLKMDFDGGTDIDAVLDHAIRDTKREKEFRDADILAVSDFVADNVSSDTENAIKTSKKAPYNTEYYAIITNPGSSWSNIKLINTFENRIEYSSEKDLFKIMQGFKDKKKDKQ